ncbi:hypothetical protein DM01DRAFT_324552 [Hesseltinella vesiculosa]|uniref:Fe2OG dioxygenase domain-containing protein n=1 Tax=Hesseltinella vesiculosa TaxID=101127 RepID=A0A1X2GXI0_9FUNG|nr:hypothetical protein DM01DRAFT_324552 [Hesseltinella vesiculosa]
MAWRDIFGSDDEDDEDQFNLSLTDASLVVENGHVETFDDVPGLILWRQALDHQQQMSMLQAMVDENVFGANNQAMRFGSLSHHLQWLADIVHQKSLLPPSINDRLPLFDQAIYNRYDKGQGIKPHVDLARFEDGIVILSLLSSCCMEMRLANDEALKQGYGYRGEGAHAGVDLLLHPGDILLLTGAARWAWTHGIPERLADDVDGQYTVRGNRVSVTLRKMVPEQPL